MRNAVHSRIAKALNAYVAANPNERTDEILPDIPIKQSAAWAAQDIKGRPLNARTEVIPEPLKARIITKGEGFAYYASMLCRRTHGEHWLGRRSSR